MLAAIHAYLIPYRRLEGLGGLFPKQVKELKGSVPDFTTIWWRLTKVEIDLDPRINPNGEITLAVDLTAYLSLSRHLQSIVRRRSVSRKRVGVRRRQGRLPPGETALSQFKTLDIFEFHTIVGTVIESQLYEFKNIGLIEGPVPIAPGLALSDVLQWS
jgi:hypothetical protein